MCLVWDNIWVISYLPRWKYECVWRPSLCCWCCWCFHYLGRLLYAKMVFYNIWSVSNMPRWKYKCPPSMQFGPFLTITCQNGNMNTSPRVGFPMSVYHHALCWCPLDHYLVCDNILVSIKSQIIPLWKHWLIAGQTTQLWKYKSCLTIDLNIKIQFENKFSFFPGVSSENHKLTKFSTIGFPPRSEYDSAANSLSAKCKAGKSRRW